MTASRRKCPSRKFRYRTEVSANNVLTQIWRKPKPGRRLETRYYYCDWCGGFHLTSKPQDWMDR